MQKLFKATLVTYTIIIGILIPTTLLLKASSFNKDYYPASFVLFVLLLVAIFSISIFFQLVNKKKSVTKSITRNILVALIAIFFIIQTVWSIDLFKESISSIGDIIVAVLYIILMLCGLVTFWGLLRRSTNN